LSSIESCHVSQINSKVNLLKGFAPDYVTEIGWPSGSVDTGRKESRVDKIEVVGGKCEAAVQIIDLLDDMLAALLRRSCIVDHDGPSESSRHKA
jgi:hypothetical protein